MVTRHRGRRPRERCLMSRAVACRRFASTWECCCPHCPRFRNVPDRSVSRVVRGRRYAVSSVPRRRPATSPLLRLVVLTTVPNIPEAARRTLLPRSPSCALPFPFAAETTFEAAPSLGAPNSSPLPLQSSQRVELRRYSPAPHFENKKPAASLHVTHAAAKRNWVVLESKRRRPPALVSKSPP